MEVVTRNMKQRKIQEERRKQKKREKKRKVAGILFLGFIVMGMIIAMREDAKRLVLMISGGANTEKENIIYEKVMQDQSEYPSFLTDALKENKELSEFVYYYKDRENYQNKKVSVKDEIEKGKIPLFMQWDLRWGYNVYGNNMIGISGCGPTCLSMVAVGLTNNIKYTPNVVAEYSEENGYVLGGNTAWLLMTEGAKNFGITGTEISLDEKVVRSYLENGKPIICSMRPGHFTTTGHFIVLTGIKDGEITINDPNSRERSEHTWSFAQIKGQIKNLWAFSKTEE